MDRRKFFGVTADWSCRYAARQDESPRHTLFPSIRTPSSSPTIFPSLPAFRPSLISFRRISCGAPPPPPIRSKAHGRPTARASPSGTRYAHTVGKIKGAATGDVACDSYHRYKEDIALAKSLNLGSYRFSISWPRIQANGTGPANPKGLDYYKRVLDELHKANIRPLVTMYHWDLPQALEDKGGWPNRDTAGYFADYANILVKSSATA